MCVRLSKDNTSLCVCFPSVCASARLGKQLMSAGMDHLGTSFHVGVSPQSKKNARRMGDGGVGELKFFRNTLKGVMQMVDGGARAAPLLY